MKSIFIRHVSHEIRTPLNIITGFTQVLNTPGYTPSEDDRKDMIQRISENTEQIIQIVNELLDMADTVKEKIAPDFAQYGFLLEQFLVNGLRKPVGESAYEGLRRIFERRKLDIENARIDQQLSVIDEQALAQRRLIESESLARKRAIEGYSYQEERSFDALEKLADNPGIGDFSNAGIGLGMMAGIGSSIGGHMNQMVNQTLAHTSQEDGSTKSSSTGEETAFCTQCGHKLANDFHFCPKCGNAIGKGAAT